jgi:O-acetylserine/cysteine efflux transporter
MSPTLLQAPMKPLDLLVAITVPILWGAGFTVAKGTFDEFPPIFLMGMRFTIVAVILIWFVKPMWDRLGRMALVAFVGGTLAYGLQFTGLNSMYASTAVLIVQLEVVFVSLFASIFFRDHLSWKQWAAMAVAFVGIALIAGEPRIQDNPIPFFMVVVGGIIWAGGQTLIKSLGQVGGLRMIAWFAAFAGPQMLIASFLVEDGQWQAVQTATWKGWAAVLYLSLIMTAAGYALWFRLVGMYRMNQVAPFILLVPVTSIIGSVVFLGEELTGWVMAGGIIILGSVAFIHLFPAKPKSGAAVPTSPCAPSI